MTPAPPPTSLNAITCDPRAQSLHVQDSISIPAGAGALLSASVAFVLVCTV